AGQHHHGALVENDVLLERKLANGLQYDTVVRLPCGNDRTPDRQGIHIERSQSLDQRGRRRISKRNLFLLCGIKQQATVLSHHEIEQLDGVEDISKVGKIAPGHKDKLAPRAPQVLES